MNDNTRQLTPEELFLFQHNGYYLLQAAIAPDMGEQLRATILHHAEQRIPPLVCEDPARPGHPKNGDIPGARVLRLSKVLSRDPIFSTAATSPRLLAALAALLEPNIEVVLNRHNHVTLRPPGSAQLEWHRDVANWSRPIITAIFYLQDSTIESGCTRVLPGSHHMLALHATLRGHGRLESMGDLGHQAVPNLSGSSRMSMTLGYHAADELGVSDEPHKLLVAGERVLRHN